MRTFLPSEEVKKNKKLEFRVKSAMPPLPLKLAPLSYLHKALVSAPGVVALTQNMKVSLDTILFFNLFFRAYVLIFFLVDDTPSVPESLNLEEYTLEPVSKRVFFIVINGLNAEFIGQNSTPFIKKSVEERGWSSTLYTRYLETNTGGLIAMLSGRAHSFYWPQNYKNNTLVEKISCKCAMGISPPELTPACYRYTNMPLELFSDLPFSVFKDEKSCLFIISFNFDPVFVEDYVSKLKKLDEDIEFMINVIEKYFNRDGQSTFIITSSRGSPVGSSLTALPPLVAWGKGIAHVEHDLHLRQTDVAALLCILLGAPYPSGMYGIIPMQLLNLDDNQKLNVAYQTLQHFEKILNIFETQIQMSEESDDIDKLNARLSKVLKGLRKLRVRQWIRHLFYAWLSTFLWVTNLVSYSFTGFAYLFFSPKYILLYLVVFSYIFMYITIDRQLYLTIAFLLLLSLQNYSLIFDKVLKKWTLATFGTIGIAFVVLCVNYFGNQIAIIFSIIPIILWPFFNGYYRRINPFVLITRLLSGIVLILLPYTHDFGEFPRPVLCSIINLLFIVNLYCFHFSFNRKVDFQGKLITLGVVLTILYIYFLPQIYGDFLKRLLPFCCVYYSCIFILFSKGTLLERYFKIFLSLLILVQMFGNRTDCVFYFTVVFHMFTWVFIEYHHTDPVALQFHPGIFSVEVKPLSHVTFFSLHDIRNVLFFFLYIYLSYFAMGNKPLLHSYYLYAVPSFIHPYPLSVSFFLAVFRFVLPFFVVTASLITFRRLQEKNYSFLIATFIWVSDILGFYFILNSQTLNRVFPESAFSFKIYYFFIQQFITISVTLSYFISSYALFAKKNFFPSAVQQVQHN